MSMRAVTLTVAGQSPSVTTRELPVQTPGTSLVSVTAAPVTPLDLLCAGGTSYFGMPAMPYVPGVQGVGVVRDGERFPVGTAVWFTTTAGMQPGDGSMAELAVVADDDLVPVPDGVDHVLAGALGLSAVAAWMALAWRGALQRGETVLILGAGGVVGQVGVQAARLLGAGRVVAACRSERSQARARELGADAVVALGDDTDRLAGAMREAAGGTVDLVLDPLFGIPAAAAIHALGPHGRLVNLGSAAGETATLDSATLRSRSLQILGYTNNELTPQQRSDAFTTVATHAGAGRLTVDHETIPLADAPAGWERQRTGNAAGRVVLVP